jgi:hypothetical protein
MSDNDPLKKRRYVRTLLVALGLLTLGLGVLQLWTGDALWCVKWLCGIVQDD